MSGSSPLPAGTPLLGGLESLRKNWWLMLLFGIGLLVVGTFAVVVSQFIATLTTVIMFGSLLLVGGVLQVVGAFYARQWGGFLLQLLAGILYLIVGFLMI